MVGVRSVNGSCRGAKASGSGSGKVLGSGNDSCLGSQGHYKGFWVSRIGSDKRRAGVMVRGSESGKWIGVIHSGSRLGWRVL